MRDDVDVTVREVGLRDGLQGLEEFLPTADKLAWIRACAAAGRSDFHACQSLRPYRVTTQAPPRPRLCWSASRAPCT